MDWILEEQEAFKDRCRDSIVGFTGPDFRMPEPPPLPEKRVSRIVTQESFTFTEEG